MHLQVIRRDHLFVVIRRPDGVDNRVAGVACAVLLSGYVTGVAEAFQGCTAVSRTTVDYEAAAGDAVVSIELMDSCRNPDMLSQLKEFLTTGAPSTAGTVLPKEDAASRQAPCTTIRRFA